jgi:hypothetical protein
MEEVDVGGEEEIYNLGLGGRLALCLSLADPCPGGCHGRQRVIGGRSRHCMRHQAVATAKVICHCHFSSLRPRKWGVPRESA